MRSVIVPAFNRADLTFDCFMSIEHETAERILVDNASTDHTVEMYGLADTVVRNRQNRGFARACNQGAAVASGLVFVFLNNDTVCHPGWLDPLCDAALTHGVAGSKLVYPDGTIQHAGVEVYDDRGLLTAFNCGRGEPDVGWDEDRDVTAVTGACMAVRRDVFETLRGFDEAFWNGYEDVDFCLRARDAGWNVRYCARSVVTHLESASGPERWTGVQRNVELLQAKWRERWLNADERLHVDRDAQVVPGDL